MGAVWWGNNGGISGSVFCCMSLPPEQCAAVGVGVKWDGEGCTAGPTSNNSPSHDKYRSQFGFCELYTWRLVSSKDLGALNACWVLPVYLVIEEELLLFLLTQSQHSFCQFFNLCLIWNDTSCQLLSNKVWNNFICPGGLFHVVRGPCNRELSHHCPHCFPHQFPLTHLCAHLTPFQLSYS